MKMLDKIKSFLTKYKIHVSVVGGALVIATAYGQCTLEPNATAVEAAVEEAAVEAASNEEKKAEVIEADAAITTDETTTDGTTTEGTNVATTEAENN
jgi:hypothetical protein